jgi:signal peptidase I
MVRVFFILFLGGLLTGCHQPTFVQEARSMAPTIRAGETVRVDYEAYKVCPPESLDIVLLHPPAEAAPGVKPEDVWMYRVLAVPGDTVSVAGGALHVNNRRAGYQAGSRKSIYPPSAVEREGKPRYPFVVPEGMYFVCGDTPNANDSRQWGALPAENIIGKVVGK